MKVLIPTPLQSYTEEQHQVEVSATSVGEMLAELDRRYPGIRFRMIDEQDRVRRHIRIFVNGEQVRGLEARLRPTDEILIFQALSGG